MHSNLQKNMDLVLPFSTARGNYFLQILAFHNIKSLALIVLSAPGVSRAAKALQLTITDTMDNKSSSFDWATKSTEKKKRERRGTTKQEKKTSAVSI